MFGFLTISLAKKLTLLSNSFRIRPENMQHTKLFRPCSICIQHMYTYMSMWNCPMQHLLLNKKCIKSKYFVSQTLKNWITLKTTAFLRIGWLSKFLHTHIPYLSWQLIAEGLMFGGQVRYKVRSLLSLICFHNFPPLMYDWYSLHCVML